MMCLVVMQDKGWAVLCSLTNKTQYMNQIVETRVYISILPTYTSILFSFHIKHTTSNSTHSQHPELSRHYVTCTKEHLSFQNTPDNLHNFLCSLWACFRYVQLYHNANSLDVDSFSTRSDGTKGQPPMKGESNWLGKNADIGYKLTPVVGSGPFEGIYLRTHPWTHMDIQCLWCQG